MPRLLAEIDRLGTNLLTVTNGQTLFGQTAELPKAAPGMIGRIGPVYDVQDVGALANDNAFRSPLIPSVDTNGLTVQAASLNLLPVVATTVAVTTAATAISAPAAKRFVRRERP